MSTATTTATLKELAALVDKDPSNFSRCRHQLPPATPVHDGSNGRPKAGFSIGDLADFILDRTGFLSEAECRLRLALGDVMAKPLNDQPIFSDAGHVLYLPPGFDLRKLTPEQREEVIRSASRPRKSKNTN